MRRIVAKHCTRNRLKQLETDFHPVRMDCMTLDVSAMPESSSTACFVLTISPQLMDFVRSQVLAGVATSEAGYVQELVAREACRAKLTAFVDVAFEEETRGEVKDGAAEDIRRLGEQVLCGKRVSQQ